MTRIVASIVLMVAMIMGLHPQAMAGKVKACYHPGKADECCGEAIEYGGSTGKTLDDATQQSEDSYDVRCPVVLAMYQLPTWHATGHATLSNDLQAAVFGSSGNDGVMSVLSNMNSLSTNWSALHPTQSGPDSAYLDLSAAGLHGGLSQPLGYIRYSDSGGGHSKLEADFSPAGVSYSRVDCWLHGSVVASGPAQITTLFGDVSPGGSWPRSATTDCGAPGTLTSMGIGLGWVSPISFKIHGDANPTICDSVRITAVNPTVGDSSLASVTWRLKNMDSLVVTDLVIEGTPYNVRVTGVSAPFEGRSGVTLAQNTPNPFRGQSTIRFALPTAGPVALRLYDLDGRLVTTLYDAANLSAGQHEAKVNVRGLHAGVYWYRLEAGGQMLDRRMMVLR